MSTDTPRTDEQINGKPYTRFAILAGDSLREAYIPSEFARQLEREIVALQKDRRELIDALMTIREKSASDWVSRQCELAIARALETAK